MARRHRNKSHRKAHKKSRRTHRKRQQQGGGQCTALPFQNAVFAQRGGSEQVLHQRGGSEQVLHQRGGFAPIQNAGDQMLLDKAAMVQAQSHDQLGAIQEAGRVAAAAQHGGRRRRQSRKQKKQRQSRKQKKQQRRTRRQRGGMSPFDADAMLLPKSAYAYAGFNPQFATEASVQPALKMGAGPQAA